jgi:hypothetical protein
VQRLFDFGPLAGTGYLLLLDGAALGPPAEAEAVALDAGASGLVVPPGWVAEHRFTSGIPLLLSTGRWCTREDTLVAATAGAAGLAVNLALDTWNGPEREAVARATEVGLVSIVRDVTLSEHDLDWESVAALGAPLCCYAWRSPPALRFRPRTRVDPGGDVLDEGDVDGVMRDLRAAVARSGRMGLLGLLPGPSPDRLRRAVRGAVVNKRAGGLGGWLGGYFGERAGDREEVVAMGRAVREVWLCGRVRGTT